MTIKLYNTLSHVKEEFVPIDPANIRMYACGPTVYDRAHIGNFRMIVAFDLLYRVLRYNYGDDSVTYVRNITDVDDKIIAASLETKESITDITEKFTDLFHQDCLALGCLTPTVEPRATDNILEMIMMILTLIRKDHAYESEGHVLFSVDTIGHESPFRKNHNDKDSVSRLDAADYKKNSEDFVLWKPSADDQPGWPSPWGRGRPGWHIECSAMSAKYLGEKFDIHGGAIDLIFPHHENEIAQSTCTHGNIPANYWIHNGFLMINGKKMSKSLGNFTTLKSLMDKEWPAWSGEVIRTALLSTHYRQELNFTNSLLVASKAKIEYLYGVLRRKPSKRIGEISQDIIDALNDDLNTAMAFSHLHELAQKVDLGEANSSDLRASTNLLGLLQEDPDVWFHHGIDIDPWEIEELIEQRTKAKAVKDFSLADKIRSDLLSHGVVLEDVSVEKTIWRKAT